MCIRDSCKGTYFPIITEDKIYGVVGFLFDETKLLIDDTFSFINVMISQTILALQRQQARKKAQEILLETEKEKMRSNLLRAVSHDLRLSLIHILYAYILRGYPAEQDCRLLPKGYVLRSPSYPPDPFS